MQTNLDQNPFFQLLVNPAARYRIARHALLWTLEFYVIYISQEYISNSIPNPSARPTYAYLSTLIHGILIVLIYVLVTQLIRRFVLLDFRFGFLLIGFLAVHVITSLLLYGQFTWFLNFFTSPDIPRFFPLYATQVSQLSLWQVPFDNFIVGNLAYSLIYSYVLYPLFLKIVKDLFIIKTKEDQLEKEKIQAQYREAKLAKTNLQLEFDFLKSQISPHFLFNTLNNIYSFSIKSPEKVPDTILKLADLMRYTLYETESQYVPLAKEISFLNSYVQLQRIRHEANADLTYTVKGEPGGLLIPPLILIVFVENAYKHGIESSIQLGWIHIELTIGNGIVQLAVANSTSPVKKKKGSAGGIGLNNVRKRLELFYPGFHQLNITSQAHEYYVNLTINLQHQLSTVWNNPTELSS